jgi:2-methylcitrate dehydratase
MINKTYVKHFPAEYHSQSAIEAALELRREIGLQNLKPADIDQKIAAIRIESFDAAVDIIAGFEEHWHPETRETADHSMPYCVSAALMDGDITLDTFTYERIHDKTLVDLIQKVSVVRSAEMNAGYPDGIPNRLMITTTDGREFTKKIAYPLGHNKNPMNDQDIEKKFRMQAGRVMSKDSMDNILDELWRIDTCEDVSEIMALFADALGNQ